MPAESKKGRHFFYVSNFTHPKGYPHQDPTYTIFSSLTKTKKQKTRGGVAAQEQITKIAPAAVATPGALKLDTPNPPPPQVRNERTPRAGVERKNDDFISCCVEGPSGILSGFAISRKQHDRRLCLFHWGPSGWISRAHQLENLERSPRRGKQQNAGRSNRVRKTIRFTVENGSARCRSTVMIDPLLSIHILLFSTSGPSLRTDLPIRRFARLHTVAYANRGTAPPDDHNANTHERSPTNPTTLKPPIVLQIDIK